MNPAPAHRFSRMNTLDIKVTRRWKDEKGSYPFMYIDTSDDEDQCSSGCFNFRKIRSLTRKKSEKEAWSNKVSGTQVVPVQKIPATPPSRVKVPRIKTLTQPPLPLNYAQNFLAPNSSTLQVPRVRTRSVNSRISSDRDRQQVFSGPLHLSTPSVQHNRWSLYPDIHVMAMMRRPESLGYESDRWTDEDYWDGDYSSITCGDSHSEGGDSGCSGGSSNQSTSSGGGSSRRPFYY